MLDGEELVTPRDNATFKVEEGSDKKDDPPHSTAEVLLQAHPDLTVGRGRLGDVGISQDLPNRDRRNIHISVSRNKNAPDRLYPDVVISGLFLPRFFMVEREERQFLYGQRTYVRFVLVV